MFKPSTTHLPRMQLLFQLLRCHRIPAVAPIHEMNMLPILGALHIAGHQRDAGEMNAVTEFAAGAAFLEVRANSRKSAKLGRRS